MRPTVSFLSSLILLCASTHASAQTGIIDPGRRVDWTAVGIPGGIPNRTTICATLNPGATAAQINAAIGACNNGVVFLNAGTFTLSTGIDFNGKSNVTLRGAGPDRTLLVFNGSVGCWGPNADICVRNGDLNWTGGTAHSTTWTGGYAKGATQITLGSTAGLSVGNILILDQNNDTADTGGVYVCDTNNTCATDTSSSSSSPGRNLTGVDRSQQQFVQVTAISGNTVTISPGLHMTNWRASQSPGAWWATTQATMNGIENLAMDHANGGQVAGILFFNAYKCWAKNVKSLRANRDHVWLYQAARIVIQDSYFYGTQNAASQSYGVETFMSSDTLVMNNIFHKVTTPILEGNSSGAVFAYNFAIDMYYSLNPTWMMPTVFTHDAGTAMNLFEGNQFTGYNQDNIHGTHNFGTLFRNQFTGFESGKVNQTNPLILANHSRYANVVGNVLGTNGVHTVYEHSLASGTTNLPDKSIHLLGWSGTLGTNGNGMPYDSLVTTTLLRWGNYDYATHQNRFVAGEIPVGNAVPSSQTLPASFFLSARPSWWGSMPWPAIGPDVTGGQDPSGHVFNNPAQVCYSTTSKDASGVLLFNANSCYGSGAPGAPRPPTNLRIIP